MMIRQSDMIEQNVIFCLWTEDNALSGNRLRCLSALTIRSECKTVFLDKNSIKDFELKEFPFHEAYDFLSATHKADYVRCYLMHHYGGGYSDIKCPQNSWKPSFDLLIQSSYLAVGYEEISSDDVAQVGGEIEIEMKDNFRELLGMCAFIFRKRTTLTSAWYTAVHRALDKKCVALSVNSARHPQDFTGRPTSGGELSRYPLKWTEILGDVLHPLLWNNKGQFSHVSICPVLTAYR